MTPRLSKSTPANPGTNPSKESGSPSEPPQAKNAKKKGRSKLKQVRSQADRIDQARMRTLQKRKLETVLGDLEAFTGCFTLEELEQQRLETTRETAAQAREGKQIAVYAAREAIGGDELLKVATAFQKYATVERQCLLLPTDIKVNVAHISHTQDVKNLIINDGPKILSIQQDDD